jgi:L-seryl-tRNA(Ser) seleniumtransferase
VGFNEEVERGELVELGKKYGLPVVEDLGSGSFIDLTKYGLAWEPTVQAVLESGVDIVTFSGDKMLGGPQAGIILGKKEHVEKIRQNQLNRALRIDKLTLLALEETLSIYRDERKALEEIPTMKMICQAYDSLRGKANRLSRMIGKKDGDNFKVDTVDGISKVGGGALPLMGLHTRLIRLTPKAMSAQQVHEIFKSKDIPIIVRVEQDKVLLDVRTIQDSELKTVASAINDLNGL